VPFGVINDLERQLFPTAAAQRAVVPGAEYP